MVQQQQISVTYNTNKMKDKDHIVISIDTEEAFDKIYHPLMRAIIEIKNVKFYFFRVNYMNLKTEIVIVERISMSICMFVNICR